MGRFLQINLVDSIAKQKYIYSLNIFAYTNLKIGRLSKHEKVYTINGWFFIFVN